MAVRGSTSPLPWPFWGFLVTILAALLLGGHQMEAFSDRPLIFSYAYWNFRLLTGYLLFTGCLLLLEVTPLGALAAGRRFNWAWLAGLAAVLTLPFFTLSVTMVDLLLGEPELDLLAIELDSEGPAAYAASAVAYAFAMELLFHVDNHLVLCALILLPRLVLELNREESGRDEAEGEEAAGKVRESAAVPAKLRPATPAEPAFFQRFEPPLQGQVLAVQAQEHYVRVITSGGALTTLYRFGDALRELESLAGLQVHRSFWVADAGVAALKSGRRGLRIVLRNGEQVPVSAKHADDVQRRFGERLETVA